jgi:formate C-acetyltransferase
MYNFERSKDINYISSLFFNGCIENAKSLTQGGGDYVIASPMLIGITNLIDSLCVIKQFVYEDKIIALNDLINALKSNWQGYEDLHLLITKKCSFFGNDDTLSNGVASQLYNSLYTYLKNKKNIFGYQFLVGDLLGYNEHHKWFGENTKATPDGRYTGEMLKFGIGQSGGNDRNGLTALLSSVAKCDKHRIMYGSSVTNLFVDEQMIRNDESFDKLITILETYFKMGGTHFQLNYVSKEDLKNAKIKPEDYKTLRVRVSGFSDYFVNLNESVQDDIIERTVLKQ